MEIKDVKVVPVIQIVRKIGKGTNDDPFRDGIEYRDLNGKLLFCGDAKECSRIDYEIK